VEIRPYREGDLPQLAGIWNEARRGSHEFIPHTEERLKEELKGACCVLVAVGEDGEPLGFSLLAREWYGEEIRLYARPGPNREEIERRLLAAIEEEAETGELVTLVSAEDRMRLEFFEAEGYKPESSLYQMIIELSGHWTSPQVPSGYLLRSLRPDEEEALIRVVNTAYQGERLRPGVLERWQEEDPAFKPEWVQVAEHQGRLVAAVVARTDREFNLHYKAKRGYMGPAATLPEHRGRGLNKALTVRALDLLREQGLERACLYTWSGNAAALRVLRSLGFQVGHEWKILEKRRR